MIFSKSWFALFFVFASVWNALYSASAQSITESIRISLEKATQVQPASLLGRRLIHVDQLYPFYAHHQFLSLWSSQGKLSSLAYEFRYELRQSKADGLEPQDYHLTTIDASFEKFESLGPVTDPGDVQELAQLDILLTDAFFALANDLDIGKINPSQSKLRWSIPRASVSMDYEMLLWEAWQKQELGPLLRKLYPHTPSYEKGKRYYRQLLELSQRYPSAWKALSTAKPMRLGDSNPLLKEVRERLKFWGYSTNSPLTGVEEYDSALFQQVIRFQKDRGIVQDGVLGNGTLKTLNESPEHLMDKIIVNLERLRWIPDSYFDQEAVLVNIPSFRLVYRSARDTLFSTKVIVGKVIHPTPIFAASLSYLVFSPYWNIPPSIAKNETLPAIRKNRGYLQKNNMEVVTSSGRPVPLSQVNWYASPFPYLIRQKPGSDNALGLVKFMFPNPNNVYLHDTPSKHLFDAEVRTFSHGCIRMQHPKEFAKILLRGYPGWTEEKMEAAMHLDHEEIFPLNSSIPIAILYLTFLVEEQGRPRFFPDVYGRDDYLLELLRK